MRGRKLNNSLQSSSVYQERLKGRAIQNCIEFNMGYLFEQMDRLGEATETYKQIIARNAYYVDAYIKLSYLAWRRGSKQKASEYADLGIKKMEQTKQRPDLAVCWKAYMVYQEGDFGRAKSILDTLKSKYEYDDVYACLFIAMIYYQLSIQQRQKPDEQRYYLRKMIDIAREKLQ